MKLAVIFNSKKFSGRLTQIFTGCHAYHAAWVDDQALVMYDMHLIRRRRAWPHYPDAKVLLFDVPEVTREYLEHQLSTDDNTYGWADYLLFALRPLYHLLGRSTRNAGGVICSEMIANDMRAAGVPTPWDEFTGPPSPCDLYRWANSLTELQTHEVPIP